MSRSKLTERRQNLQPSQSFKYRGVSLFAARAVKEHGREVHLVAASSGNAGLALAWVGKSIGKAHIIAYFISILQSS